MPRQALRTLRYPIFTGGVVAASGICSACFLRKRRRGKQPRPLRLLTTFASTSPKGRGLGIAGKSPRELQSLRFRQRLPPRGSWQNRQVLTEGVQPSPWGRWLDAKRQDGRGVFLGANSPSRLRRQPPLRWGLWHNGKVSGSTAKLPVSPEAPSQRELAKPSGFD